MKREVIYDEYGVKIYREYKEVKEVIPILISSSDVRIVFIRVNYVNFDPDFFTSKLVDGMEGFSNEEWMEHLKLNGARTEFLKLWKRK